MIYHGGFVRTNAKIILSSLSIILVAVFTVLPCFGESVDSKPAALTLKVENLPLEDVLKRISHDIGFEIIVNPPWGQVPLSLNLKDTSLEEGIRKIIQALGKPSHFIVTNEKDKKVTLLISGLPSVGPNTANEPAASLGNKTISPDGKGFLTAAELKAIEYKTKKYRKNLPKDTVIGPPSSSGGPGLTIRQLEAVKQQQKRKLGTLPPDTIIGPPSTSGGPGLTLGQLEAVKEKQKDRGLLSKDSVIGPPSMSGGPRLTFGELEAIKKKYQKEHKAQPEAMKIKRP
jgi:hypothetical protein